ncbi:MAG: AAA family ATPase, partial [Planctomycetales bacterium]
MSLKTELREYVEACFTGLWITSHEPDDAITEIAELCREQEWKLAVWDIDQGLRLGGQAGAADASGANDPLAAVRSLQALATPDGTSLLILSNFHKFLGSPEIIQAVARQVSEGKLNRTFIIVLAPVVDIPIELEKQFVVLEHPLPTREQLLELARGVASEPDELPRDGELERT